MSDTEITITKKELMGVFDDVMKSTSEAAKQTLASAFEQFAKILEEANVTTNSPEAEIGALKALRVAADEALKVAAGFRS